jgi:hypothetical protein
MINASIIADSVSPKGHRITTFILEYPRMVHAEFMTHRVFSRNAASSRAIPIKKMVSDVISNPASPIWWGVNQKGMAARQELTGLRKRLAQRVWFGARYPACGLALLFNVIGLHKQIANRVLEPWFNIRVIATATDLENFFALRCHPDAQPEIKELADKMLAKYRASLPIPLKEGEWHVPFARSALVTDSPDMIEQRRAIARCARISYLTVDGKNSSEETDLALCDKLFGSVPRHLSPAEHVARCTDDSVRYGNFIGWMQYRKTFADESSSFKV